MFDNFKHVFCQWAELKYHDLTGEAQLLVEQEYLALKERIAHLKKVHEYTEKTLFKPAKIRITDNRHDESRITHQNIKIRS